MPKRKPDAKQQYEFLLGDTDQHAPLQSPVLPPSVSSKLSNKPLERVNARRGLTFDCKQPEPKMCSPRTRKKNSLSPEHRPPAKRSHLEEVISQYDKMHAHIDRDKDNSSDNDSEPDPTRLEPGDELEIDLGDKYYDDLRPDLLGASLKCIKVHDNTVMQQANAISKCNVIVCQYRAYVHTDSSYAKSTSNLTFESDGSMADHPQSSNSSFIPGRRGLRLSQDELYLEMEVQPYVSPKKESPFKKMKYLWKGGNTTGTTPIGSVSSRVVAGPAYSPIKLPSTNRRPISPIDNHNCSMDNNADLELQLLDDVDVEKCKSESPQKDPEFDSYLELKNREKRDLIKAQKRSLLESEKTQRMERKLLDKAVQLSLQAEEAKLLTDESESSASILDAPEVLKSKQPTRKGKRSQKKDEVVEENNVEDSSFEGISIFDAIKKSERELEKAKERSLEDKILTEKSLEENEQMEIALKLSEAQLSLDLELDKQRAPIEKVIEMSLIISKTPNHGVQVDDAVKVEKTEPVAEVKKTKKRAKYFYSKRGKRKAKNSPMRHYEVFHEIQVPCLKSCLMRAAEKKLKDARKTLRRSEIRKQMSREEERMPPPSQMPRRRALIRQSTTEIDITPLKDKPVGIVRMPSPSGVTLKLRPDLPIDFGDFIEQLSPGKGQNETKESTECEQRQSIDVPNLNDCSGQSGERNPSVTSLPSDIDDISVFQEVSYMQPTDSQALSLKKDKRRSLRRSTVYVQASVSSNDASPATNIDTTSKQQRRSIKMTNRLDALDYEMNPQKEEEGKVFALESKCGDSQEAIQVTRTRRRRSVAPPNFFQSHRKNEESTNKKRETKNKIERKTKSKVVSGKNTKGKGEKRTILDYGFKAQEQEDQNDEVCDETTSASSKASSNDSESLEILKCTPPQKGPPKAHPIFNKPKPPQTCENVLEKSSGSKKACSKRKDNSIDISGSSLGVSPVPEGGRVTRSRGKKITSDNSASNCFEAEATLNFSVNNCDDVIIESDVKAQGKVGKKSSGKKAYQTKLKKSESRIVIKPSAPLPPPKPLNIYAVSKIVDKDHAPFSGIHANMPNFEIPKFHANEFTVINEFDTDLKMDLSRLPKITKEHERIEEKFEVKMSPDLDESVKLLQEMYPDYKIRNMIHNLKPSTENMDFCDRLWTDLFRPSNESQFCGNGGIAVEMRDWLSEELSRLKKCADRKHLSQKGPFGSSKKQRKCSDSDSSFSGSEDEVEQCLTRVCLVSGPSGVGKTCLVYALAQQLGYSVLESNSEQYRNNKKLVGHLKGATESHRLMRQDSGQSGNGKRNSIFSQSSDGSSDTLNNASRDNAHNAFNLILIDDADILFNTDDGFWAGVSSLSAQSRVPIIITCTDISAIDPEILSQIQYKFELSGVEAGTGAAHLACIIYCATSCIIPKQAAHALMMKGGWNMRQAILQAQFMLQNPIPKYIQIDWKKGDPGNIPHSGFNPHSGNVPHSDWIGEKDLQYLDLKAGWDVLTTKYRNAFDCHPQVPSGSLFSKLKDGLSDSRPVILTDPYERVTLPLPAKCNDQLNPLESMVDIIKLEHFEIDETHRENLDILTDPDNKLMDLNTYMNMRSVNIDYCPFVRQICHCQRQKKASGRSGKRSAHYLQLSLLADPRGDIQRNFANKIFQD